MGKKKDDDDKELTPSQIAVRGGLIIGGIFVAALLLVDAGRWAAGGPATLTARIGAGLAVLLFIGTWWTLRRHRKR